MEIKININEAPDSDALEGATEFLETFMEILSAGEKVRPVMLELQDIRSVFTIFASLVDEYAEANDISDEEVEDLYRQTVEARRKLQAAVKD